METDTVIAESRSTAPSNEFDALIAQALAEVEPNKDAPEDSPVEESETIEEPVEEAKPEETDEGLTRVAARESAVAAKEKEIEVKLAELKRFQLDNKNLLKPEELRKEAETNLSGVLTKLGLDQEFVMDVLIAEKLGDKAPAALKDKLRDYSLRKEIESIRAERDHERRALEAKNYYDKVSGEAREYVTKAVDVKAAPTVSLAVKEDADLVHSLVLKELENDARDKLARGETDSDIMTYADAVANVEKLFSKIAKAVSKKAGETSGKKPAVKPITPVTKTKSGPVDEVKDLEEKGIQEALKVFEKANAPRR